MTKQIKANLTRPGMRQGSPARRVRPSGVAQYGQHQGRHITNGSGTGGEGGRTATDYHGINAFGAGQGLPSELGNAVAERTQCGPGGSRTVSRSGTQGTHGSVPSGNPPRVKNERWPI